MFTCTQVETAADNPNNIVFVLTNIVSKKLCIQNLGSYFRANCDRSLLWQLWKKC